MTQRLQECEIAKRDLFQAIVEQAPDAVIFADRDGAIALWNEAAQMLFGYSAAEVLGKSLDVIIPERLRSAHWAGFNKAMDTGHAKYTGRVLTTRSAHKDGSKLYVDLSFALVRDEGGAITGALAIGRNCTDRYLADGVLRTRIAELEKRLKNNDDPARSGHEGGEQITDEAVNSSREHGSSEAHAPSLKTRQLGHLMPDDEHIRRYLSEHLVHASHFPALIDVMFDVKDGYVTLSGTVPHRVMKQSIEDSAAACPGVRHVENNLNVALTAPWPDPVALRSPDQG